MCKNAVIVFLAIIKVVAMKFAKFLLTKPLKLALRYLISNTCGRAKLFKPIIIVIDEVL